MTSARWSTWRRTGALLDAYAGLEDDAAAVGAAWTQRRAAEEAVAAHRARVEQARREADYLRHAVEELDQAQARNRRGDRARREARHHDAGRQGGRGSARRARGGRGRPLAGAGAVGRAAPARAAARAGAGADRSAREGARRGADRARRRARASRRGAARRRTTIRASSTASRSGCSRCARPARKYNVAVDDLAALRARYAADLAVIDAGAEELKRLEAAAREAEERLPRAPRRRCRPRGARPPRSSTRR